MSSVYKVPARSGLVVAMTALVAFFLSVGVIAEISAKRLASDLAPRLRGQVTVVVWGRGLESADAAAARAAELLTSQPGLHRIEVLEGDERDALIGAIIAGPSNGLESPRLISFDGTPPNHQLSSLMTRERLTATFDDHRETRGILERRGWALVGLGLALSVLLFAGFAATCFVTGVAETHSGNPRIELMMRLGAEPSSIASMVGRGVSWGLLGGSVFGALCAIFFLSNKTLVHGFPGSPAAVVLSQVRFSDYTWLALCPATMTLLGAATASLGLRQGVARRERDL